jgi:CubicO group peptidase (beta-lactamase class C family)
VAITKIVTYDKEVRIGLGWHIGNISGNSYYWHNGATGGSRCFVAFQPDKNTAVVVLSNAAEDIDDLGKSILKILQ